jgi:hypothetical protein
MLPITIRHAPGGHGRPRSIVRRARFALVLALAACGGCDIDKELGFGSPPPFADDAESFGWLVGTWSGEGPEGPVTLTLCDYSASGDHVRFREAAFDSRIRLPDGRAAALSGTVWVTHAEPPDPLDDSYRFRFEAAPDGSASFLRVEMRSRLSRPRRSLTATVVLGGSYALGWGEEGAPPVDDAVGPFEGWVEWRDIVLEPSSTEADCTAP